MEKAEVKAAEFSKELASKYELKGLTPGVIVTPKGEIDLTTASLADVAKHEKYLKHCLVEKQADKSAPAAGKSAPGNTGS